MPTKELTATVKEAKPQDARRNIARLDPQLANQLGARTGDVVQIEGDRRTVARLYQGYPQDAGTDRIRIDGATRHNAGAGIDDRVQIRSIDAATATQVTLAPTQNLQARGLARLVARRIGNRPVSEGDTVNLDILGHHVSLRVTDHAPPGEAVVVEPGTQIQVTEEPVEEPVEQEIPEITYEDIGGLDEEIRKVREMIELPLRHPEIFDRIGVEPPKGLLLHGPPGTGKTMLAKAVANESGANFYTINGPEIMSKYYGESEERLRETFEDASENEPAIIFIDEIDSIAPKRDEVTGEVERRVVSQLLTLMDGMEERGRVIVVAATNRVDSVDTALRRAGRFDREIEIGVPDDRGREEILTIHTRGMPLAEDTDLEELAERTHGYVGADLAALAREAAMNAVQRILPEIDFESEEIPPEVLDKLEVTLDDLERAFRETTPSAMREVLVQTPDVTWDDVGGLEEAQQELIEAVQWPLSHASLYDHMGAEVPKGVLLYGPPGTGKTLIAKALAKEAGVNFISIKGPELLSKWVGESEKGVREIFRKARQNAPCVMFFDEIEALAPERGGGHGDSRATERVVSQFLTELDGLESLKGVVVIGATNRKDLIDEALLRPGRFDRLVPVDLPSAEARREILKIHTRDLPLGDDVDLDVFVDKTEGFSGAELAAMAHEASLLAIRDFVEQGHDPEDEDSIKASRVDPKHLEAAFQKVQTRSEEIPAEDARREIS